MTNEEAARLRRENVELTEQVQDLKRRLEAHRADPSPVGPPVQEPERTSGPTLEDFHGVNLDTERLYQAFKLRLTAEAPALLRVLTQKPEIRVEVEKRVLTMDGQSIKGRIARMLHQGFFSEARTCSAVRRELQRTGSDVNTANIGKALDEFTREGFTTREGNAYLEVAGMKVHVVAA